MKNESRRRRPIDNHEEGTQRPHCMYTVFHRGRQRHMLFISSHPSSTHILAAQAPPVYMSNCRYKTYLDCDAVNLIRVGQAQLAYYPPSAAVRGEARLWVLVPQNQGCLGPFPDEMPLRVGDAGPRGYGDSLLVLVGLQRVCGRSRRSVRLGRRRTRAIAREYACRHVSQRSKVKGRMVPAGLGAVFRSFWTFQKDTRTSLEADGLN